MSIMNTNVLTDINKELESACECGDLELAKLLLSRGADEDRGLWGACRGGHLDLVILMLHKGAYGGLNTGLKYACKHGHLEIVELMIRIGVKKWDCGLCGACEGGHVQLVELMITRGANNFYEGLCSAFRNGHIQLFDLLISHGADYQSVIEIHTIFGRYKIRDDLVNYIEDKKKTINVIMGPDIGSLVTKYLWPIKINDSKYSWKLYK